MVRKTRHYSDELKRQMALYASQYGTRSAARHFSLELGHRVPVSTIHDMKKRLERRPIGASFAGAIVDALCLESQNTAFT